MRIILSGASGPYPEAGGRVAGCPILPAHFAGRVGYHEPQVALLKPEMIHAAPRRKVLKSSTKADHSFSFTIKACQRRSTK